MGAFALLFLLTVLLPVTGCQKGDEPPSSSINGDSFLRCAQPYDDGFKERFELRPLIVERDGYHMTVHGIKRGQVVLGLMAGIMEPEPGTLDNVRFFLEQFRDAGVQAILVAGGFGLDQEHLTTILKELANAPVPILLVPGAGEHFDVFRRTVAHLRERFPQLTDMTRVRRVSIGQVDLVSLPGYYRPHYLLAEDRGCSYTKGDLEATAKVLDPTRLSVLIAPTPPRSFSGDGVDRGRGGINMGDPALTAMMAQNRLQFGIFGHVYESGGNATGGDGRTAVLPGVWHDALFLQAGAVDAVPVPLVGGGRSVGMAHIVEFSGKRGRFRALHAGISQR